MYYFSSRTCRNCSRFTECVAKLKEEFEESRIPLSDDNLDLQRFFAKIEYLLQAGMKGKQGYVFSPVTELLVY